MALPHPCTVTPGTSVRAGQVVDDNLTRRWDCSRVKQILVTGVLTDASLAFAVARLAQQEGAEVVLSGAGRGLSLTRRTARKLPAEAEVLEIDVAQPDQLAAAAVSLADGWDRMDGMIHAIGYAPPECLGGDMFRADWDQVQVALHVSAYSLKALVEAFRPLLVAAGGEGRPGPRSSVSTSTPRWPGRPTTGWGCPRRRSSRCRAIWPATSARSGSG